MSAPRPSGLPPKPTDNVRTLSPQNERSPSPTSPKISGAPTSAPPKPPKKGALSQSASVATFNNSVGKTNVMNQRPGIKKQNSIDSMGIVKPPTQRQEKRKSSVTQQDENALAVLVSEQEQKIEELQQLVKKLTKKLEKQEELIAYLNQVNEQYYQNQGGYYDENGGYYDENGNYYPPQ